VTATRCGKFCHLITHHCKSENVIDRCAIEFERDVEAVALALRSTGAVGDVNHSTSEFMEAILFVTTRDGRLWRSHRTSGYHGVEFSRGIVNAGKSNENRAGTAHCGAYEPFLIMECRMPGGSLFVNCADILALRLERSDEANDNKLNGTMLVTAGSSSLDVPIVAFIPDETFSTTSHRSKKRRELSRKDFSGADEREYLSTCGEKIPGLDSADSRITSVLFVSKKLLGLSWNNLRQLYMEKLGSRFDFGYPVEIVAESFILIGFQDGVTWCLPVAKLCNEGPSKIILGKACPVHQFCRPQAVNLILLECSQGTHGICCVGSLGELSFFDALITLSFSTVRPGLPRIGMWISAAACLNQKIPSNSFSSTKDDQKRKTASRDYSFFATCDNGSSFLFRMRCRCRESDCSVHSGTCMASSVQMQIKSDKTSVSCCLHPKCTSNQWRTLYLAFGTRNGSLSMLKGLEHCYHEELERDEHTINCCNILDEPRRSGILQALTTKRIRSESSLRRQMKHISEGICDESRGILVSTKQLLHRSEMGEKARSSRQMKGCFGVDAFVNQARNAARVVSIVTSDSQSRRTQGEAINKKYFPHVAIDRTQNGRSSIPVVVHASIGRTSNFLSEPTELPLPHPCQFWVQSCHALESVDRLSAAMNACTAFYKKKACTSVRSKMVAYGGTALTSSRAIVKSMCHRSLKIRVHQWDVRSVKASISVSKIFHPSRNILWHGCELTLCDRKRRREKRIIVKSSPREAAMCADACPEHPRKKSRNAQDTSQVGLVAPVLSPSMFGSDTIWDSLEDLFNEDNRKDLEHHCPNSETAANSFVRTFQQNMHCELSPNEIEECCIRSHSQRVNTSCNESSGGEHSDQHIQSCSIVLGSRSFIGSYFKTAGAACATGGLIVAAAVHDSNETRESGKSEAADSRKVILELSVSGNLSTHNLPWLLALLRSSAMHRIELHYYGGDESHVTIIDAANALGVYHQALKSTIRRKKICYMSRTLHRMLTEKVNVPLSHSSLPPITSLILLYRQLRSLEIPLA